MVVPHAPNAPKLPMANTEKMPAAFQAATYPAYQSSAPDLPHELFTICGRRSGRGYSPERLVGARIHWALASSASSAHVRPTQPRAAIQRAPGATPKAL